MFFNEIILKILFRVILGIVLIEIFNHITIIFSIYEDKFLHEKVSKWTISISILLKGALFAVKYIVFYGLPTFFNEIVGMKTTPLPRCIFLISTNGETWKHFDTGMYEFIKK